MEPVTKMVDVKACPRCGRDHEARVFYRRTDVFGDAAHPLWYSVCPETADPLMLVEDAKGREKVAKID